MNIQWQLLTIYKVYNIILWFYILFFYNHDNVFGKIKFDKFTFNDLLRLILMDYFKSEHTIPWCLKNKANNR